jgi:hypothetical protein
MNENSSEGEALRLSRSKNCDERGAVDEAEIARSLIVRTPSELAGSC